MTLLKVPTQNSIQYTLDSQILAGATSLTLNQSVAGIVQAPGVLVIDRIDSSGAITASKREYKTFTGVSSATISGLAGGLAGSTDQVHAVGAIVEFVPDILWAQSVYDTLTAQHTTSGVHDNTVLAFLADSQTFTGAKTFGSGLLLATSPKITTSLDDANGNEVIKTPATASAVNEITVTNSATGNAVAITATGGDTNIELQVGSKGNKQLKLTSGFYQAAQSYSPSAAATATLDLSLGNDHVITMPAGNITIALSNEQVRQKFIVSITQDGTGSRTVTWFSTIKWAGGAAPTLTTTLNKRDIFGFIVTGSGTYDGVVVAQNV